MMNFIEALPKKSDKKDYSLLVKHNNLVQGKYSLDASEQKLLYKIFEEIQKKEYTTREVRMNFQDFYKEYKSVLGMNITKTDFKNLIERVQDKKPYIIKGDEYIRTQWYKIYGKLDLSEVRLELDVDVFEYVQALDKNFTGLRLETLYSFKSFHSMRIYELLKQWCETRREIPYTLDTIKELLGVEENAGYKNFTNFKKYVLDKALKEINEKSELTVEMEAVKEGRKVVGIVFKIVNYDKPERIKTSTVPEVPDEEPVQEVPAEEPALSTFFIPEELKMDSRLKGLFEKQFNQYDFNDVDYMTALIETESMTLLKDDASSITALNYKLFAKILSNKIETLEATKRIELEEAEENKYWQMLSEVDRELAFIAGLTCKEYYEKHREELEEEKNEKEFPKFVPKFY